MSKRPGQCLDNQQQPLRKRQRLHASYNYVAPNAQTLRSEFEETVAGIEEVIPRQANLENLVSEWNDRMEYLGGRDNNISYLVSKLDSADYELMKQITSLTAETLQHCISLRKHSSKCCDIMLNKLEERRYSKKQQYEKEKMERDSIRIPSKDIWSQSERINYFRDGSKAAIKTEVKKEGKTRKKESKYIVTKIIKVNHNKQECILIDDESTEKQKYYRSFKHIMPLPTLSVVSLNKRTVFKSGQRVLAVYPSTTCFYAAKIVKSPNGKTKYSLKFEDDGDKIKDIEAEKIMPYVP